MLASEGVTFDPNDLQEMKKEMINSFRNKDQLRAFKLPLLTPVYRNCRTFIQRYILFCCRKRTIKKYEQTFFEKKITSRIQNDLDIHRMIKTLRLHSV
jgi:hypothetical protein